MATGTITKRAVDAFRAGDAPAYLWDETLSGFGLKVTPTGVRTYVFSYRMGGREAAKKRVTIGRHGSPWTPTTARQEAERLALLVGQGIDPALADKERRRQAVDLAFGAYADRFVAEYLKSEWKGGWELAAGILKRDAKPAFAGMALPQITRGHVSSFLDSLSDRPAVRRNAFAVLRRMFRWAVGRGDLVASPILDMEPPAAPAARDRVLSDDELCLAWEAAGTLGYPFGPMFRLLIASGQRREEVAGLDWSELNRASATWTLPAARAKNGLTHIVPLSPLALSVLDETARVLKGDDAEEAVVWPRRGWVFSTTGTTAVSGYSKAKARLDSAMTKLEAEGAAKEQREAEAVPAWRVHDLRRTVATGLQRLGIRFEVTEAVLAHVSGSKGGVAGVYQRHDWKDEKRTALEAWGWHVTSLTTQTSSSDSNVVQMVAA